MKKQIWCLFVVLVLFVNLSFVSAGVFFSGLESKYNLGDVINVNVQVDPARSDRFLKTVLVCGTPLIEFNNIPDDNGNVDIKIPLNMHTIQQISGKCYFQGSYISEVKNSEEFEISRRLEVSLHSYSFFANPGEEIIVSGGAKRLNGALVNGGVEMTIPLLKTLESSQENQENKETSQNVTDGNTSETNETDGSSEDNLTNQETEEGSEVQESGISVGSYYGKIENGEFSVSIKLKEDTPAGEYRIDVLAYEELDGERASEGGSLANLKVFQVLKGVDIALSKVNLNPGENLEFNPSLIDQTGRYIEDEISIIIRDKDSNRIYEKIVKSQQTVSFPLLTNLTSGYYVIEARSGDFNTTKKFYVNEKAIASFILENQTLTVTNIGNIPYKRDIEIILNDKVFLKRVDLNLGESTKFKLTGKNEAYNIKIGDGESEILKDGVVLTGYAVNVKEGNGISSISPVIWIFIAIILGIGILFLVRNIFKKRSYAYYSEGSKKLVPNKNVVLPSKLPSKETVQDDSTKSDKVSPGITTILSQQKSLSPRQAEQDLVSKGRRDKATVLALKIKKRPEAIGKETIEKAMELVYQKKGAVYEQGDYIYSVFSSLMTGNVGNDIEAVKIAHNISSILQDYNRKFKEPIDYGIGINVGEIINKVEDKKLKFTALGNLMIVAKKLAELSDKKILISKETYDKLASGLNTIKVNINGLDVYEVKNIINKEDHKKFIDEFMKRNKDVKNGPKGFGQSRNLIGGNREMSNREIVNRETGAGDRSGLGKNVGEETKRI